MTRQGCWTRVPLRWTRGVAIAALAAGVALATPAAQQQATPDAAPPAQQAPASGDAQVPPTDPPGEGEQELQPTFRTGINFVSVDAIITDRRGNPVDDLTIDDFEVFEDGQRQDIETFKLIRVDGNPGIGEAEPRAITSTYAEEAEARRDDVRLFVIFFDDYHVRLGASLRIKEDLIQFIQTQLGPKDMIAMMYPLDPVRTVSFTRNHQAIIRAIERWQGWKYRYTPPRNMMEERYSNFPVEIVERLRNQVSLSALQALMWRLGGLREGRKSVIVVSEGYTDYVPPQMRGMVASMPGLGAGPCNAMIGDPSQGAEGAMAQTRQQFFGDMDVRQQMRNVYTAANRNNVSLYMLDPRGLTGFEFDINECVGQSLDSASLRNTQDTLRTMAGETDGRAIIDRNDLSVGLRQMVRDASAYYLLGYSSIEAPTDGRFHQIRVRVKRPGVEVRHRKGYWALRPEEAAAVLAGPREGPPPDVTAAVAEIERPARARTLRSWVGYAPDASGKTRVIYSWEPVTGGAAAPSGPRVAAPAEVSQVMVMAANDAEGPLYRGRVASGANGAGAGTAGSNGGAARSGAGGANGAGGQVSFLAAPGALQMRLSAEDASGGVVDSDMLDLTVPDLSAAAAIGTPALFRARTQRDLQALVADPDARPTAARSFSRAEKVLLRFSTTAPEPTARLLNREGSEMSALQVRSAAEGGPFTHEAEVPVNSLPAGEFIVEVKTGNGDDDARQLAGVRITP
jgi:VWFA-related protein